MVEVVVEQDDWSAMEVEIVDVPLFPVWHPAARRYQLRRSDAVEELDDVEKTNYHQLNWIVVAGGEKEWRYSTEKLIKKGKRTRSF